MKKKPLPRISKLENPILKKKVVEHLAIGTPQEKIALEMNLNQSNISRFRNRDEIRDLIEQEQKRLLEVLPDAVENVKTLVTKMKDVPEEDARGKELAYKASKDVLKSVGIMPTPARTQILNIFNQQSSQVLHPAVQEVLSKLLPPQDSHDNNSDDDEIIDIGTEN